MSEKKVIAVIVEGPSDENAIGGILKEHVLYNELKDFSDDEKEEFSSKILKYAFDF